MLFFGSDNPGLSQGTDGMHSLRAWYVLRFSSQRNSECETVSLFIHFITALATLFQLPGHSDRSGPYYAL